MENTKIDGHTITLRASDSIDAACQLFEADLRQGERPFIEQYLTSWEEPERSKLLFELLKLEIEFGVVTGESTARQALFARFPEHKQVVEEAFVSTMVRRDTEEKLTVQSELRRHSFLGQGGLGIVYIAEDQELQRETAVKFIQDSLKDEPRSQEQFRLEAEITGRLEHPGIVPVHGLGKTADGRMFYVMRLIRGEGLDEAIAKYYEPHSSSVAGGFRKEIRFHELLTRFAAVCKTIAYAHNRGVIHRDIKPGNIMLGRFGETVVIDWGLGAHVGRTGVFKESGEKTLMPSSANSSSQNARGGTPPYMSPEQAAGREDLGPGSDIYSLGATLYTVLTGKIPFIGSAMDIMNRVMRGDFAKPKEVNPSLSKALEAICLKAMSLNPQLRYTTALELAEDIERFLADAPVKAYDEPRMRKLARWARRHRSMAQTGLFGLVLLAGAATLVSAVMVYSTRQANHLKAVAQDSEVKEQALRRQSLESSAEFAAQSIANQVDVRWRVLEREAANTKLGSLLAEANSKTGQDGYLDEPIQKWLDERIEKNYRDLTSRAWTVYAADGSLIARNPNREANGDPVKSMGQRFAYRDYFHGEGQDYKKSTALIASPLKQPHRSAVFQSVSDDKFVVILSVPI